MKLLPASQLPDPQRGSPQRPQLPFWELLVPVVPPSPRGAPRSVASSSSQQMNLAETGLWPTPRKHRSSTDQQCPPVAAAVTAATRGSRLGVDTGPWMPTDPHRPA